MRSSHASETTLNDGRRAPVESRSSRPDTSGATVQDDGDRPLLSAIQPSSGVPTLNGITPRPRRVTSDDAANPRTTLTCGLWAPVPVRSRFPEARHDTGGWHQSLQFLARRVAITARGPLTSKWSRHSWPAHACL